MGTLNYLFRLISVVLILFHGADCELSDRRACGNPECTELLSLATTLIKFPSNEKYVLSFPANKLVKVFSMPAGSRPDLCGVEIDGIKGYAPARLLKETRVFKKPTVIVPTEFYEIVDGEYVKKKPKDARERYHREMREKANIDNPPDDKANRKRRDSNKQREPSEPRDLKTLPGLDVQQLRAKTYAVEEQTDEAVAETGNETNSESEFEYESSGSEGEEDEDGEVVEELDEEEGEEQATSSQENVSHEVPAASSSDGALSDNAGRREGAPAGETPAADGQAHPRAENSSVENDRNARSSDSSSVENEFSASAENVSAEYEVNVSRENSSVENELISSRENDSIENTVNASRENSSIENELSISRENTSIEDEPVSKENAAEINNNLKIEETSEKFLSQIGVQENTNVKDGAPKSDVEVNVPSDSKPDVKSNDGVVSGESKIIDDKPNNGAVDENNNNAFNESVQHSSESDTLSSNSTANQSDFIDTSDVNRIDEPVATKPDNQLGDSSNEIITEHLKILNNEKSETLLQEKIVPDLEVKDSSENQSKKQILTTVNAEFINAEEAPSVIPKMESQTEANVDPINVNNVEVTTTQHDLNLNLVEPKFEIHPEKPFVANTASPFSKLGGVDTSKDATEPNPSDVAEEGFNYLSPKQGNGNMKLGNLYLSPVTPLPNVVHSPLQNELDTENETNDYTNENQTENITSTEEISPPSLDSVGLPEINEIFKDVPTEASSSKEEILPSDSDIPINFDLSADNNLNTGSQDFKVKPVEGEVNIELNESREADENASSFVSDALSKCKDIYDNLMGMFKSNNVDEPDNTSAESVMASRLLTKSGFINDDDTTRDFGESRRPDYISSLLKEPSSQCSMEERSSSIFDVSGDLVFWLVTSAVTVLMFTLGYYYLDNRKQDGKLLAMVNSLQKELLCVSKECIIVKEELTVTKEKLIGIEDSSFGTDEMVACLRKELAESQQTICDLQDKLASSEEELANSAEAAMELQAILDDQLSSNDSNSPSLSFTVGNLQTQLDEQQTTISLTKGQLAAKVEENELLMMKIVDIGNKYASMEKDMLESQEELRAAKEENEARSREIQQLTTNLEKSLQQVEQQKADEIKELQALVRSTKDELDIVKVSVKAKVQELTTLKENVKLLKMDGKNIDAILDVGQTKAELTQAVSEKSIIAEKLERERVKTMELTAKLEDQDSKMSEMKEHLNEADQKAYQATSRLEVLTNYFNQKEADLLKELSTKESLWLSQQGEAMSTVDKIQSLQQESQQYKETAEGVKREMAEQEASWRARLAALEGRAHQEWLARRAAERAAEAAAREAQGLRQRLTAPSPDKRERVVSPLNSMLGEGVLLPPLGGMLPPPLSFLPPPPMMLPPLLPPHRPPPLGRLSSPPPLQNMRHNRYSPDSRHSHERAYSPETRRSTPQRGRSPYSPQQGRRRNYNNGSRRYEDDRYYDSGEDRRSRHYDETETDFSPPTSPRRPPARNHIALSDASSGSGQSSESLGRKNKHAGKF